MTTLTKIKEKYNLKFGFAVLSDCCKAEFTRVIPGIQYRCNNCGKWCEPVNTKLNVKMPIEIPNVDRVSLAKMFGDLGFKVGAEIGVERGLYSKVLLDSAPGLHLILVDPWLAYQGYREHVSQEKLDRFLVETEQLLSGRDFEVRRGFSVDVAKEVPDESLDFVYIDGNHEFSHVVADIAAWYPKVKKGGIIAGHDFISRRDPMYMMHVVDAVVGYTNAYRISPWFVMGSKERIEGQKRDSSRSWFFVKPEEDKKPKPDGNYF